LNTYVLSNIQLVNKLTIRTVCTLLGGLGVYEVVQTHFITIV